MALWILILPLSFLLAAASNDNEVYIVYMGGRGVASSESLFSQQKSALMNVFESEADATSSLIYNYKHTFSGFSARLTSEQAKNLAQAPGVISVFKSRMLELHTTNSWEFLGLTSKNFDEFWNNNKTDVIVGLLDTGIWPESESFRDDGMGPVPKRWKGACLNTNSSSAPIVCNRKIIGARSYYTEATPEEDTSQTLEYTNARDSNGHGTHTASTFAGRRVEGASLYGLARGYARGGLSRARIAVYKVCFYGQCPDHALLAAFDDAVQDGVDLLSVSLGGSAAPFHEDSIAIGSFHAMKQGILVSCSAGNQGPVPFTVENVAPWVLTVGSSSTNRNVISSVKLGNNETIEGCGLNIKEMNRSSYDLIYARDAAISNTPVESASYCVERTLDEAKVKDQIVLCRFQPGTVGQATRNLQSLGAAGVIQINEQKSGVAFAKELPFTIVDTVGGSRIFSYLNSTRNPTAIIDRTTVVNNNESNSVSVFSSRGPSKMVIHTLKPDLIAPGSNVLAAWTPVKPPIQSMSEPQNPIVFNMISGTSMACPHAAGAAAMVKSLHPDWSPAMIKSSLMTTANAMNIKEYDGKDNVTPFDLGAGQISPLSATDPGLVYDIDAQEYVNYLCALNYTTKQIEIITGSFDVDCNQNFKAHNLNYPTIFISNFAGNEVVSRVVTNVGATDSVYNAVVEASDGLNITVSPSELKFDSKVKTAEFQVHFEGKSLKTGDISFGSVMWKDAGGHNVRSPTVIVAG